MYHVRLCPLPDDPELRIRLVDKLVKVTKENLKENNMPHDAKGREVKPGDLVLVPFKIKEVYQTQDFCNVNLETVATMPPEHKFKTDLSAVNTKMLIRANRGDELDFEVIVNGTETRLK